MTKPFHAGAAARDAVMALELAEAGFTANTNELEAPSGFLERYGDPELAPLGDAGGDAGRTAGVLAGEPGQATGD